MFDVSYFGALTAGLLSFLSPCVLPLVPAYLGFLGGTSLRQMAAADGTVARSDALRVLYSSGVFVLGFAAVFVALGASATVVHQLLAEHLHIVARVAGAVLIVFGVHYMGLIRIGVLFKEARFHVERKPPGLPGAFVLGLAFAFGWTPCVGPILAAILTIAASQDSAAYGASLLFVYALGIGLPFVFAAAFAGPFLAFMARFKQHSRKVELVVGLLLVATGTMMLAGSFQVIGFWLLETFPSLGQVG